MFFIIGTRFIAFGSAQTAETIRCSNCGALARFTEKTGMRFITLFFVLPVLPVSGRKSFIECPNCKTRFQTE